MNDDLDLIVRVFKDIHAGHNPKQLVYDIKDLVLRIINDSIPNLYTTENFIPAQEQQVIIRELMLIELAKLLQREAELKI